jgi:hypothetical protein
MQTFTNSDLSSEVAALKRQVAQLLRLFERLNDEGKAKSISQFSERNSISRSFFYKLKGLGKAPRIMEVEGRQIISPEAERDWRLEREAEAVASNVVIENESFMEPDTHSQSLKHQAKQIAEESISHGKSTVCVSAAAHDEAPELRRDRSRLKRPKRI